MKTRLIVLLAVICVTAVATAQAQIDRKTIVGLWTFDEGKGNTAEDSSGKGYDGSLEGAPKWVEGKFGKALDFNGSDYVEIKDSAANLSFGGVEPFTISAWVNNRSGGTIVGKFNGGVIGAYILIVGAGGAAVFHREVAPWGLNGALTLPQGKWGHIAATYDGTDMKIFIEGKQDVTQARPAQNTDRATPVFIGARMTGGAPSEFYVGQLDEVALFNVALTPAQITEAMLGLGGIQPVAPAGKVATVWGRLKTSE